MAAVLADGAGVDVDPVASSSPLEEAGGGMPDLGVGAGAEAGAVSGLATPNVKEPVEAGGAGAGDPNEKPDVFGGSGAFEDVEVSPGWEAAAGVGVAPKLKGFELGTGAGAVEPKENPDDVEADAPAFPGAG